MMRVALHSVLVDGEESAYVERHVRIPADLRALFARAGIADWTIWRSGRHLFHLVECDDFAHAMSIVDADPSNTRWQADIGRFVDGFRGGDDMEAFAALPRVWRLTEEDGAHA
jgi:L-rhamnose mutarotase